MHRTMVGMAVALLAAQPVMAEQVDLANGLVHSFEQKFGVTEGKRRNHTKGFCFSATLTPGDAQIRQYSNSPLFSEVSRVVGRLSHKGGKNNASDDKAGQYGMGLSMTTPSGATQTMSMNTLPFFPVATPQAFAELMRAKVAGGDAVKAFKAKSPDLQRFKAHMSKQDKSLRPYEAMTFNSINSFYLVNAKGEKSAVRWSFAPSKIQKLVTTPGQDFLMGNMQKNLSANGVVWDMLVTFANPGDEVDNAAIPWTGKHKQLVAAKLRVQSLSTEAEGQCDGINFDPLALAKGMVPSNDPILVARQQVYALTFGKRIVEQSKQ